MAKNTKKASAAKVRKKKVRRNITKGVAHIHATFNNTIVTIADEAGVPVNPLRMLHSCAQKQQLSLLFSRD